jgi:hypothetical protein
MKEMVCLKQNDGYSNINVLKLGTRQSGAEPKDTIKGGKISVVLLF